MMANKQRRQFRLGASLLSHVWMSSFGCSGVVYVGKYDVILLHVALWRNLYKLLTLKLLSILPITMHDLEAVSPKQWRVLNNNLDWRLVPQSNI